MSQTSCGEDLRRPVRLRDRQRDATRRLYLEAAVELVRTEGEAALSMKRITTELATSVGGIYRYYSTRDDLLTAVRRERADALDRRATEATVRPDATLENSDAGDVVVALGRVIAVARFWSDTAAEAPAEADLARTLIAAGIAAARLGEASDTPMYSMIDRLARYMQAAADADAIGPGDAHARAALVVEVSMSPVLATGLGPLDSQHRGAAILAARLVDQLLMAWGTDRDELELARSVVEGGAAQHPPDAE